MIYIDKKAILNWELSELDYKAIDHFTKLVSNNFKDNKKFIFIENKNKEITILVIIWVLLNFK